MRALRERVVAAVRREGLWQPGQAVAIAVSGGLDSVVLLDVLARTAGLHGGLLTVHTVDHGTREGSAEDARFVAELATAHGLSCAVHRLNLGPGASEASMRRGRREALEGAGTDVIALAHHADDHAETFLLRALRGTGPRGLCGLRPRHGRYVRPLLGLRRAELLAYARDVGLAWREDPSNDDPRFARNRVRHELLPLLEDLRPGAIEALARTARLVGEESAYMETQVDATAPEGAWSCSFLAHAPPPIVRRAVLRREPHLQNVHIDALIALARRGSGRIQLPGGRQAIADAEHVYTSPDSTPPPTAGGACDT